MPSWLVGTGIIAVAMGVMNVATYGFTILAARYLGPREYGALAALMGLLLVVNVVSLGLQATAARRVSASPTDQVHGIESDILAATYRSAAALGLICLAASPVVTVMLRLDSWVPAALIAVTAVPLTIMGGQAGLLQGERRWLPLAAIYVAVGLGRVVMGLALLVALDGATGAMVGVAIGAFAPVVLGVLALRHPARRDRMRTTTPRPGSSRRVLRELFHNSLALLAFFTLSNADVVIARITLDEHDAGLYAGGLILAKAVLFLPQFVVVVAFPSMSSETSSRRMTLRALGLVLGIGSVATAGAWLLQDLAVQFIGGAEYDELASDLWAFAAVGTIWAMTQLLVYNVVAQQDRWLVGVVWVGLAVLVALTLGAGSLHGLLVTVVAVEATLLVVLVALTLRRDRQPAAA